MRNQLAKLDRKHSTKAERKFAEVLKKMHIPFRAKAVVNGREVDFIIGKVAVDIDGHDQDPGKNAHLLAAGYIPVHFSNIEIRDSDEANLIAKLKKL